MTRGRMMWSLPASRAIGIAEPADETIGADREITVAGGMQPCGARLELQRKRLLRGGLDRLGVRSVRARNGE